MRIGLAGGYRESEKKSLLKPYTNFDKMKDMDIDSMAEQLAVF